MSVLYVSGEKPSFSVGRDPGSDLVLDGTYVSRHHLILKTVRHDVATVEVLGNPVQPAPIQPAHGLYGPGENPKSPGISQ